MTIKDLFLRERRCTGCKRVIPADEAREGPYFDHRGHGWCMACIVSAMDRADAVETDGISPDEWLRRIRRVFGGPA